MISKAVTLHVSDRGYQIPEFVQLACKYGSHIVIRNNHNEYNAKSIMGMMSMDPTDGPLIVCADGADEEHAVNALAEFLANM